MRRRRRRWNWYTEIIPSVEDEWSGLWAGYIIAMCTRQRSCTSIGRHFRRIVDRVRDDDGDLKEVLESQGRTTNNKSVGRNRFPHGSRPVAFEPGRRCGLIVRHDTSPTRQFLSLSLSPSITYTSIFRGFVERYIWLLKLIYILEWQLVKVVTRDQRCSILIIYNCRSLFV